MLMLVLLRHPVSSSSMLDSIAHPSAAAVLVLADAGKLKGSYITAACHWQLGGRSHRGRRRCSSIGTSSASSAARSQPQFRRSPTEAAGSGAVVRVRHSVEDGLEGSSGTRLPGLPGGRVISA